MSVGAGAPGQGAIARAGRWLAVRVWPSANPFEFESRRAAVLAALFVHGPSGVQEDGAALVTFFPEGSVASAALRNDIAQADAGAHVEVTTVEEADWGRRWREGIRAHTAGAFTVTPPWLGHTDAASTIVIDPGMAFGTGEHETTRGVLRLLPRLVRPGDLVADLGAGSGILSIAAAKLGAARVMAIEIDPDAIGNATANVARNGVADRVHILEGDAASLLPLVAPVRVVIANIVSTVLIDLLPTMADALSVDGRAVLSGVLIEERDEMVDVVEATGWHVEQEHIEARWWTAIVARQ